MDTTYIILYGLSDSTPNRVVGITKSLEQGLRIYESYKNSLLKDPAFKLGAYLRLDAVITDFGGLTNRTFMEREFRLDSKSF